MTPEELDAAILGLCRDLTEGVDEQLDRVRQELQRSLVEYAQLNPIYAALSGQRLVDVVAHHEFQKLADGVVQSILLVLGALLDDDRRRGTPSRTTKTPARAKT